MTSALTSLSTTTAEPLTAALMWPFPEPSTEDMLLHLQEPRTAIAFAIKKLPDHEIPDFLRDWQSSKPLKPYLDALELDRRMVAGEPDGGPASE